MAHNPDLRTAQSGLHFTSLKTCSPSMEVYIDMLLQLMCEDSTSLYSHVIVHVQRRGLEHCKVTEVVQQFEHGFLPGRSLQAITRIQYIMSI